MKQGDGSDLLGPGDPRNSDIGILYVTSADSRQDILTAINTQELQGRKQIAIVLPDQGKAFRQPVDFDGLKTVRRTLKAQAGFYRAFRFQSRGIRAPAPLRGLFFAGHI